MNLNDLRMSLKAALDNMWARIDARITAIEQGGGVTGVKGDAESSYRQGNVNLTPANIGAVDKTGDTMTGQLTFSNSSSSNGSVRIFADNEGGNIEIVSPNGKEYQIDAFNDSYLRLYTFNSNGDFKACSFDGETGAISAYGGFVGNATNVSGVVAIDHGGTGVTQGTIDITDYCVFDTSYGCTFDTGEPYGGRLYYNKYLNCVFGNINVSGSVPNQAPLVTLKDNNGNVLGATSRKQSCGIGSAHFEPNESKFTMQPRLENGIIRSSHSMNLSATSPKYTIMAFVG